MSFHRFPIALFCILLSIIQQKWTVMANSFGCSSTLMADVDRQALVDAHNYWRSLVALGKPLTSPSGEQYSFPRAKNMYERVYSCEMENVAVKAVHRCKFDQTAAGDTSGATVVGGDYYTTVASYPDFFDKTIQRWVWNFYNVYGGTAPQLVNGNGLAGAEVLLGKALKFGCAIKKCADANGNTHYPLACAHKTGVQYAKALVASCNTRADCTTYDKPWCLVGQSLCTSDQRCNTQQLIWSDEFDGAQLDTTNKWTIYKWDPPNNELQQYAEPNLVVANGNLVLTARAERLNGRDYTSGRIGTGGKFTRKYGLFEARIKMPMGQGLWPAFWLTGADETIKWPEHGEIDIMEHVNSNANVEATVHWSEDINIQGDRWHVYSAIWDVNQIRIYLDETLYYTLNISPTLGDYDYDPFHTFNFMIILNLAVGGNMPGFTIDNSKLPASMYVDWVRVYDCLT